MDRTLCPFCKEAIAADAMICKHCHKRVYLSREDRIMAGVVQRLRILFSAPIEAPSLTPCRANCYAHFAKNKAKLDQCLDECRASEAIATLAERLHRELVISFAERVWGGGDIDPVPFEKAVRERFSQRSLP